MGITDRHRDLVAFHLLAEERDLIIRHAHTLDAKVKNRLHFGRREGARLNFELTPTEFNDLLEALAREADDARERAVRRSMNRLYEKLGSVLNESRDARPEPDADPFRIVPPELREQLGEILNRGRFDSIDEINAALQAATTAYNNRPVDEFLGLSPLQLSKLLNTPWDIPGGVRLATNLESTELCDVPIVVNARSFLREMYEQNGVPATARGNLNRKFVEHMFAKMRWPDEYIVSFSRFPKIRNEVDVLPLNVLRIVLAVAGLIRRTKGTFKVTRNGKRMMEADAAGELFVTLFNTYFRKFNLGYLDFLEDCPGIQHTIPFIFYAIRMCAGEWVSVKELTGRFFLPSVLDEIRDDLFGIDFAGIMARRRVLEPLREFGLIEYARDIDDDDDDDNDDDVPPLPHYLVRRVRRTPLFDRFISFDLS